MFGGVSDGDGCAGRTRGGPSSPGPPGPRTLIGTPASPRAQLQRRNTHPSALRVSVVVRSLARSRSRSRARWAVGRAIASALASKHALLSPTVGMMLSGFKDAATLCSTLIRSRSVVLPASSTPRMSTLCSTFSKNLSQNPYTRENIARVREAMPPLASLPAFPPPAFPSAPLPLCEGICDKMKAKAVQGGTLNFAGVKFVV